LNAAQIAGQWALPLAAALPVLLILLIALAIAVMRLKTRAARYVLIALWLRFAMDSFSSFALREAAAGVTWNAVGSILLTVAGLLVIRHRHLLLTVLLPIYALLAIMVISSFANGVPFAMVEQSAKFGLLICMIVATYEAANEEGPERFAAMLMVPFLLPIAMQAISVALGIGKLAESDGSLSYVAGFFHESVFSISVAAGLVALCFAGRAGSPSRIFFLLASAGALIAANYRTTLIAMLPLLIYLLASIPVLSVRRNARLLVASVGALLAIVAVSSADFELGDRAQSVIDFATSPNELIRPLDSFTEDERRQASGRSYVWSKYIEGFNQSPPLQKLIGHGPDSWEAAFNVYAQNTVISYLYEIGWVGAGIVIILWLVMLLMAFRTPRGVMPAILLLHLGYAVLNMSTQPFWAVEGLMMYGLICGFTLHYAYARVAACPSSGAPIERRVRVASV
jgi:hypothetical protein